MNKRKIGKAFRISEGKGFRIRFENGWGVSVQFGPGNNCDNYDMEIGFDDLEAGNRGSNTAEIAINHDDGQWCEYCYDEGEDLKDIIRGHVTPKTVLDLMNYAAALKTDANPVLKWDNLLNVPIFT